MKWNENEILGHIATKHPDWEGQLSYKAPKPSGTFSMQHQYKERYLKLFGNILVLSKGPKEEQTNIFVMENFTVQVEDKDINNFSIIFHQSEGQEKHLFVAVNLRAMNQWLDALKKCSIEKLKETLVNLQVALRTRTGIDPLVGTNLEYNPNFSLKHINSGESLVDEDKSVDSSNVKSKQCHHNGAPQSTFTSHLGIQIWEETEKKDCGKCDKTVGESRPSFKSHNSNMISLKNAFRITSLKFVYKRKYESLNNNDEL